MSQIRRGRNREKRWGGNWWAGQLEHPGLSSVDLAAFKIKTHDIPEIYIKDHWGKSSFTYVAITGPCDITLWHRSLGMVACAFQHSGGRGRHISGSLKPVWSTWWVQGQRDPILERKHVMETQQAYHWATDINRAVFVCFDGIESRGESPRFCKYQVSIFPLHSLKGMFNLGLQEPLGCQSVLSAKHNKTPGSKTRYVCMNSFPM